MKGGGGGGGGGNGGGGGGGGNGGSPGIGGFAAFSGAFSGDSVFPFFLLFSLILVLPVDDGAATYLGTGRQAVDSFGRTYAAGKSSARST